MTVKSFITLGPDLALKAVMFDPKDPIQ